MQSGSAREQLQNTRSPRRRCQPRPRQERPEKLAVQPLVCRRSDDAAEEAIETERRAGGSAHR